MAFTSRELRPARHVVVVWRADELEDAHALVDVGLTFQDGLALEHFAEDASDAPQVDGWRVSFQGEEEFWRPVPSCDDQAGVISHCLAIAFAGLRRSALVMTREAEVGNLEEAAVGDEDVGGFHVAVEDMRLY